MKARKIAPNHNETLAFWRNFHFTGFQIVGSADRGAGGGPDRASWGPANQATHGGSPECRPTNDFCVLHLRAMPDIGSVMRMAMFPVMIGVVRPSGVYPRCQNQR